MLKPILLVSLFSVSLFVQAAGIGNIFGALMGKSGSLESETTVDNVLTKVSAQMNGKLPIAIDSDTRLDSISAVPGRHLIYHYTLVTLNGDDVKAESFHNLARPQLKNRLCDSAEMQNFLKNGVTISYLYKGKDGQPIGGAKFVPSDCGYQR
ncbi:MAG: hypothetical protein A3I66_01915 [Burkholderiales bacterium RIFCSPLOWO2_02_FULL_57_36]|nr:MAG: hypothetical protein A3I66_01915 [Burkholderiales bacterium RIFCSPLOWO2_02_FULL_57_36]